MTDSSEKPTLTSNEEVQPARLAERIYDMACATVSAWNGGEEIPYELKQALNQWIVDAKKPNWLERPAPETCEQQSMRDALLAVEASTGPQGLYENLALYRVAQEGLGRHPQKANPCSCGHDGPVGPGHQGNCPQYREHAQNGSEQS